MRECWPRALAAGVIASLLVVPSLLTAQANLAQVEDAATPPKGFARLRVLSSWTRYNARFDTTETSSLGDAYTSDALGTSKVPELGDIESLVQSSSGSPFTLSLGRSTLNAVAREVIIPFALEYGITNRLSIGVVVPVVHKRATLLFLLDSTGSNVGPNPALTSPIALALTFQVQGEFAIAAVNLQERLTACQSNPAAPGCASIIGREAEAMALLQASAAFAAQLSTLFGSGAEAGMPFVPRASTSAYAAIAERVATFNTQYKDFLSSSSDLLVAVPMGARGGAGVDEFQRFLFEDLGHDSLVTHEQLGIGDVEIGAKFLVVDAPVSETRRRGLMLAVASSVRLPTGSTQTRGQLTDLQLGEGQVMVDSRGIVDGRLGRLGLLAVGQFAFKTGSNTPATLGHRGSAESLDSSRSMLQLHVAPRFHISEPFSFHGAYSVRTTDKSGGDQLIGGGVSFSTLAQFRSGAIKALPMEMRFTHLEAIGGDPGRPKFFRDQIEVRIYYPLIR